MHRMYAVFGVLILMLGAGAALAEQATGTVDSIDPTTRTVVVGGQPYIIETQASGMKFDEIKVGDKVTLEFDVNTNDVSEITHAK